MEKPDITIQTKVGEILEYYPELEEVLLNMSPAFVKLKNPILRKTVAKVASLKQVAEVGNLDLSVLITTLRNAAGLSVSGEDSSDSEILKEERPIWAKNEAVTVVFDACPVINGGGTPMQDILSLANALSEGEILKLLTPFVPAPIIGLLRRKGYRCWSCKNKDKIETYISV